MSTKDTSFIVIPLNLLPSERDPNATEESIEAEKQTIRERIFNKSNSELSDEDMVLLRALGSDLNINAFALNFRYSDGRVNDDVEEANYLNRRVVEVLSVDSPEDDPTKIPFYLTSTEFGYETYGNCAQHFKKRLGLTEDKLDLFVLRNVLMNPFPTEGNFVDKMMGIFKDVVEKEVEVSICIIQRHSKIGLVILYHLRSVESAMRPKRITTALSCKERRMSTWFIDRCSTWPADVGS